MPAMIRSAARGKSGGGRSRKPAPAVYAPTKLHSVAVAGVDLRAGVWIAAGIAGAAFLLATAVSGARALEHGVGEHGIGGATGRVTAALGFRLHTLTIVGGDAQSRSAIAEAAALHPGDAVLGIDLDRLRERVEGVGWVKSAKVRRLLPDTIVVSVQPRTLLAVWQHDNAAKVVDADGAVVPEARPAGFTQLPLVVGEGANEAAARILPLVEARPRLMTRIDALQRVDGRRWRLMLKDGGVIDLPAKDEDQALLRFDQLDARLHCLELGFKRIDLRDPSATDVRMKDASPAPGTTAATGAVT